MTALNSIYLFLIALLIVFTFAWALHYFCRVKFKKYRFQQFWKIFWMFFFWFICFLASVVFLVVFLIFVL